MRQSKALTIDRQLKHGPIGGAAGEEQASPGCQWFGSSSWGWNASNAKWWKELRRDPELFTNVVLGLVAPTQNSLLVRNSRLFTGSIMRRLLIHHRFGRSFNRPRYVQHCPWAEECSERNMKCQLLWWTASPVWTTIGGVNERLVFLNTRRHSGNICQLVCLLWKTGSRKHEWGSLGGHRIELIDAAMTRKEQERRQGTVQEPVSVEWWWPRRRFNKMGSIIRLLANQSAANPRRKVLKHR